jgi:hypothetical protein
LPVAGLSLGAAFSCDIQSCAIDRIRIDFTCQFQASRKAVSSREDKIDTDDASNLTSEQSTVTANRPFRCPRRINGLISFNGGSP